MLPLHTVKFSQRVSLLLILSLLFFASSLHLYTLKTDAAALTGVSDTMTDSDVGVVANHTIIFTTPSGYNEGDTINITFPAEFDTSAIVENDVDVLDDGVHLTTAASCLGSEQAFVAMTGQLLSIEICATDGGAISSTSQVTILVGSHASSSGSGTNQITNSTSTGSFLIPVAGSSTDSANFRIVIIDDVVTTAQVDTALTFTIAGLATSTDVNGATTTISTVGSSTTLPFGTLPLNTPVTLGQQLSVSTNAVNGFVVTVVEDNNLLSSTGADIDLFQDGATTSVPIVWTSPSSNIANEETWGHMGVTSEDDLNSDEFGTSTTKFAGNFNTARQVFSHTGPADGTTANIGLTQVAYRIEITALQESGNDYTNTLTYISTATF